MLPKTHIVLGLIFSLGLLFIFPEIGLLGFFVIWISSVLIDIDHYLFYVFLKKDWNLNNSFKWFIRKSKKFENLSKKEKKQFISPAPCFLHGIEMILILAFLSFFHKIFLYILIGFLFHQFLDLIALTRKGYAYNHIGIQTLNFLNYRKKLSNNRINIYS